MMMLLHNSCKPFKFPFFLLVLTVLFLQHSTALADPSTSSSGTNTTTMTATMGNDTFFSSTGSIAQQGSTASLNSTNSNTTPRMTSSGPSSNSSTDAPTTPKPRNYTTRVAALIVCGVILIAICNVYIYGRMNGIFGPDKV